jgi:hypothetical protein
LTVDAAETAGSITVRAAYTTEPSIFKEKAVDVVGPDEKIDFKVIANAALLGLSPASNYSTGGDVIDAMDLRYNKISGYNPSVDIDGTHKAGSVFGTSTPLIAWFIDGNNLKIYEDWTGGAGWIIFNIAIINTSSGEGWIIGDANNKKDAYAGGTRTENIPIPASAVANLSDYRVYVLVRGVNGLTGDFNTQTPAKLNNVMFVYPYPAYPLTP